MKIFTVESEIQFDAGKMVIFRLTNGDAEKFLHLYNSHNGHYGHGFEFGVPGREKREDTL